MKKVAFFILGKKGYSCLVSFIEVYGAHNVEYVVSAEDKGVKKDYFIEISQICRKHGIDFYLRPRRPRQSDVLKFAIGWRWMIHDSKNLIVFHDSLLPKYRGFAPLVNMLINGEKRIGVTALWASKDYDAGDIIDQEAIDISYPIKISEAIDLVSSLYGNILLRITQKVFSGADIAVKKQDNAIATFSLWRDEVDYQINWRNDAEAVRRFVDAVGYPYSGAKTKFNGRWVRIFSVEPVQDVEIENREAHLGKIIFMANHEPTIVCGQGLVKIKDIVDETNNSLIGKIPFRTRFGY